MADKRLTDEEILKIVQEFRSLADKQKDDMRVGAGRDKLVYNIPNTNYVLKEARENIDQPVLDYIALKQLSKYAPTETPILVAEPNQPSLLLQKKLNIGYENEDQRAEETRKLRRKLEEVGIQPHSTSADLHLDNVALDDTGRGKIIDTGDFFHEDVPLERTKNKALFKARDTAIEKIKNLKSPKIYRSIPLIGPAIGAGLAAMSGDANAASGLPILGEAESLGPEQGSEDYEIENPQRNPAARRAALKKLSR